MIDDIEFGLTVMEKLSALIPVWIERARKAGELTAEQEQEYQRRQKLVFSQPYAQPETTSPPEQQT